MSNPFGLDTLAPPPLPVKEWPKQKAWSISAASNHNVCPLKFRFQRIDRLPEPQDPSGPLARGLVIHERFAAYLHNGAWPESAMGSYSHWTPVLDDLRARGALAEQQAAFTAAWAPCGWYAPDVWFRAVFDAVVPPSGENDWSVEVTDWKSGRKYDKHPVEARIYSLAALKLYPDARSVITKYQYVDRSPTDVVIHMADRAAIVELERSADAMSYELLHDILYPARPGPHCRWCYQRKSINGQCAFG